MTFEERLQSDFEELKNARSSVETRDFYYLDELMELCNVMGYAAGKEDFEKSIEIAKDAKAVLPSTNDVLISFDKEKIGKWFFQQEEAKSWLEEKHNEHQAKLLKYKKEISRRISEKRKCSVYYILNAELSMVKIGISENVKSRIKNMQTSTGYELELLHTIVFPSREEALNAESFLHSTFSENRKQMCKINKTSEWFDAQICGLLMANYSTKQQIENSMKDTFWKERYNG